jgi:Fe-S-cluster containining protein
MTKVCFDYDPLLYTAGAIGEKRYVRVIHRQTGDEIGDFPNRTAFYGHYKKKAGGWLAEYNQGRTSPRTADEFDYIDVQEPEPIEYCMHTLKNMILRVKDACDASSYYGYSGKGKVFREDVSTVMMYKGNRLNAIRPLHLDDLKEYLVKSHACKIIGGIEADDAVSIDAYEAYKKWKQSGSDSDMLICSAVDKDYKQCSGHWIHPETCDSIDTRDADKFGWLKWNEAKNEADGRGRMWLYWQIISGDDADNYCAHAAYDGRDNVRAGISLGKKLWGAKTAFPYIENAKTDKEAWEGLVKAYQYLYPKPQKVVGWRGYEDPDKMTKLKPDWEQHIITVDWLSMLQENATLAFMLRWRDDKIDVKEILNRLEVEHDAA